MSESKKTCFVICPIGESDSSSRKWSDKVLKHIIRPVTEKNGYEAIRADEISEPGMITTQVIQKVIQSELVVADLSERNPNVFYELAVRHAIKKPLIQLINSKEEIPFDIAGTRTIHLDLTDLDSVEDAKREMNKQIISCEKNSEFIDSPISVSMDLYDLRQSESIEDRSIGEILGSVTELRKDIYDGNRKVSEQLSIFNAKVIEQFRKSDLFSMYADEINNRMAKHFSAMSTGLSEQIVTDSISEKLIHYLRDSRELPTGLFFEVLESCNSVLAVKSRTIKTATGRQQLTELQEKISTLKYSIEKYIKKL